MTTKIGIALFIVGLFALSLLVAATLIIGSQAGFSIDPAYFN